MEKNIFMIFHSLIMKKNSFYKTKRIFNNENNITLTTIINRIRSSTNYIKILNIVRVHKVSCTGWLSPILSKFKIRGEYLLFYLFLTNTKRVLNNEKSAIMVVILFSFIKYFYNSTKDV